MRNYKFLFLLIALYAGVSSSARSEDKVATSQETVKPEKATSDRFIRRVIFEGSLANAGYLGDDSTRYSKPNGYTAGVLLDLGGAGPLVLETGVIYRQFGATFNSGLGDATFTANYISVPITAKYYLTGQENTSLYVKGGILASTLISNSTLYASPTTQIGARSWETAFIAGLGIKFNFIAATDLLLEVDYTRSIDSVFSNSNVYRSDVSAGLGFAVNL